MRKRALWLLCAVILATTAIAGIRVGTPHVGRGGIGGGIGGVSPGLADEGGINLFVKSEELDNASWAKTNCTVSANATAAPDGATTADKIVSAASTTAQRIEQSVTVAAGTSHTISFYVKAITGEVAWVNFRLAEDTAPSVWFNVSTGTLGTRNAGWTASAITGPVDGWYRISATHVSVGTSYTYRLHLANGDTSTVYTGDGIKGVFAWGGQVEPGTTAGAYLRKP